MIYNNFNLQDEVWHKIQTQIKSKKLPNAFLFYGSDGSGKEGYGIELGAALNCDKQSLEACGQCSSCKKIISFQHGNIKLIIPYPRGKISSREDPSIKGLTDQDISELEIMQKNKGINPFCNIYLPKSNTILINSIRELKSNIYLSSIDKGYTIILIFNGEKLCKPQAQSGNALLKLLEEPPSKTIFIIITSHIASILPTIRSRCQEIFFPPLKTTKLIDYINKPDISNEEMKLIANIANGNMKIAIELLDNVDNLFKNLKIAIKSIFSPSTDNWQDFINKISSIKRNNSFDVNYFFRTMILYFRDLMLHKSLANNKHLIFLNLLDHYQKINMSYQNANWNNCISIVENIYNDIERNGYVPLQSITLLIEIQSVLNIKEVSNPITH